MKVDNSGFKVLIDDVFPNDIQIHNIDINDKVISTTTIKISPNWLNKIDKFINSNKKILKLSTWIVNADSTNNESFFYFETTTWNREIYCYTLGHLTDYTNLKYSKDRNYLYKLFTTLKGYLLEVGINLNIDSYEIKV